MPQDPKYRMTISLNALDDLGKKLYSNVPAVLAELVANAHDADASQVNITIGEDSVIIEDDGEGMSVDEINNHFLTVGYKRRIQGDQPTITPKYSRRVMGCKGIGKLSVFAIADNVEVYTNKEKIKNSFGMISGKILEKLKGNPYADYEPDDLGSDFNLSSNENGTKIVLSNLTKKTYSTPTALRKRISRRFNVFSDNFKVYVNDEEIKFSDRDYFHKMQFLWSYSGKEKERDPHYKRCDSTKLKHFEKRNNTISPSATIRGWIGTVELPSDLKDTDDNINKITVMARGKLIQEDILDDFNDGGVYTKYIIGEIDAEFLDNDEGDILTSNRQSVIKDDPRYGLLKEFLLKELKNIQSQWTNLRNVEGEKKAKMIPAIKEWYEKLNGDEKTEAKKLFGKVNQVTLNNEEERKTLFKHCVLAFESSRYKRVLSNVASLDTTDLPALLKLFDVLNDIDATLYHQTIKARLEIINLFMKHVDEGSVERVLQEKLYGNLWLLDPSWDRSTEAPSMERTFKKYMGEVDAKLSDKELKSRYDIKYKNPVGKHVIIELKKADTSINELELLGQVQKYRKALQKITNNIGKPHDPIEIICLLGKEPSSWATTDDKERGRKMLAEQNARIVLYGELIQSAYNNYKVFLEHDQEAGELLKLIYKIDDSA